MKMNPTWKAKWVAALRSGKYKQGQHQLRQGNSFCCLGVLCAIHPKVSGVADGFNETVYTYKNMYGLATLPSNLRQDLSISYYQEGRLIKMNDSGWSFARIADWIEKNL